MQLKSMDRMHRSRSRRQSNNHFVQLERTPRRKNSSSRTRRGKAKVKPPDRASTLKTRSSARLKVQHPQPHASSPQNSVSTPRSSSFVYDVPYVENDKKICSANDIATRDELYRCYAARVSASCDQLNVEYEVISLRDVMLLVDCDEDTNKLVLRRKGENSTLARTILGLNKLLDKSLPDTIGCADVGVNVQWSLGSMILWCSEPTEREMTKYRTMLDDVSSEVLSLQSALASIRTRERQKKTSATAARRSGRDPPSSLKIESIRRELNDKLAEQKRYEAIMQEIYTRKNMRTHERAYFMDTNQLVLVWDKERHGHGRDRRTASRTSSSGRNETSSSKLGAARKLVGAATLCKFVSSLLHTTSLNDIGRATYAELQPYFERNYYYIDVMCSRKKGVGTLLVHMSVFLALKSPNHMDGVIALSFRNEPIKGTNIPQSLPIFMKHDFKIIIPLVEYPKKHYYGVWLVRQFDTSVTH